MAEARNAGVDGIIDHKLPFENEIEKEIDLLAKQQEKLLNELKSAYEQDAMRENDELNDEKVKDLEERLRAMNIDFTPKAEQQLDGIKNVRAVLPSRELSSSTSNESRYSKMDQVKFFKDCLPQILLGPFLDTLTQMFCNKKTA